MGSLRAARTTLSDERVRRRLRELFTPPQPRRAIAGVRSLPWLLGRGPSLGVLGHLHARWRPDGVALIDGRGALTWRELDQRANRLARLIEAHVPPGGRVTSLLRNGREWVEVVVAAQRVGRVAMPLNTWGRGAELRAILEREDPHLLVYDTRHASALEEARPTARMLAVGHQGRALPGSVGYEAALADVAPGPVRPFTRRRGKNQVILQTSGTTGVPKGAVRETGGNELAALLGVLATVPFREDDVVVVPAPLFHAFGLLTFSLTFVAGATTVLPDRFDPADTYELVARHRATGLAAVPVMLRRMLRHDDETGAHADVSSLRLLLASGDAMSPELRQRLMTRFGPVLHDLYGSTEAGWIAVATPGSLAVAPGALGRPVPGVRVRILDDRGRDVAAGEHGEIHVSSAARFTGYTHQDGGDTGAVATGDLGWLDGDGLLHVAGRSDDMVIIGGENVYPAEVERVIDGLDEVVDTAVIGVPHPEYGQVLAAFVTGEVDTEAVRARCEQRLASFKVPRWIEVVDELPRTTTGKIQRHLLTGNGS